MSDVDARRAAIVAVAAPCWAGEAEIVRTYLREKRTPARDVTWLAAQAWKETRLLRALPPDDRRAFLATGTLASHPEGPEAIAKLADEMRHYHAIVDCIADLRGARLALDDLAELPEETALQAMRAPYRRGTPLERAAVNFTEGGGGAMYWVLARLEGGPHERRLAEVFAGIYADEVAHGPGELPAIARHATSAADWAHATAIVRIVSRQRLRMRNEMFSEPLAAARLDAIAAGAIEPWPLPCAS